MAISIRKQMSGDISFCSCLVLLRYCSPCFHRVHFCTTQFRDWAHNYVTKFPNKRFYQSRFFFFFFGIRLEPLSPPLAVLNRSRGSIDFPVSRRIFKYLLKSPHQEIKSLIFFQYFISLKEPFIAWPKLLDKILYIHGLTADICKIYSASCTCSLTPNSVKLCVRIIFSHIKKLIT